MRFDDRRNAERHEAGARGTLEPPERETRLWRAGAELWNDVIRQNFLIPEDTRAVLQAIRTSLDASRRLRFAGDVAEDEWCRLAVLAAEAAEAQEHALWLWYVGRGFNAAYESCALEGKAFSQGDRLPASGVAAYRLTPR